MEQLPSAFDQTVKTIKIVRNTLAAAGHPEGSYKIVLTGYPNITPDFYSWKYSEGDRREQQCPVVGDDARYIHGTLVPSLNATMQAVAEETGVGLTELFGKAVSSPYWPATSSPASGTTWATRPPTTCSSRSCRTRGTWLTTTTCRSTTPVSSPAA